MDKDSATPSTLPLTNEKKACCLLQPSSQLLLLRLSCLNSLQDGSETKLCLPSPWSCLWLASPFLALLSLTVQFYIPTAWHMNLGLITILISSLLGKIPEVGLRDHTVVLLNFSRMISKVETSFTYSSVIYALFRNAIQVLHSFKKVIFATWVV